MAESRVHRLELPFFAPEHTGLRHGCRSELVQGKSMEAIGLLVTLEARYPRFAPVPQIFMLITPVLRVLAWASSYSEGDRRRSPCAIGPTQFARSTFPTSGTVFRAPSTFPLISSPRD